MSIKLKTLLAVASISLSVALPAAADAIVDQAAPLFTGKTADGTSIELASLRGKTVVLEWTNHECPYVKKHYDKSGNIPAIQKEATADGVVWLQVISSASGKQGHVDGNKALALNKERGAAPSNVILDASGEIGKLYQAQTTPHIFIIDKAGTLVYKGGIDSIKSNKPEDIAKATPFVKQALSAIKAGSKIEQNNTQPYGCSVKYAG